MQQLEGDEETYSARSTIARFSLPCFASLFELFLHAVLRVVSTRLAFRRVARRVLLRVCFACFSTRFVVDDGWVSAAVGTYSIPIKYVPGVPIVFRRPDGR